MATVRLEARGGRLLVHVAGALDIYAVKEAFDALRPALQTVEPALGLELAGVEEIDLAGVQLLHWLRASAEARGLGVELLESSPAVETAARSLELAVLRRGP